jgi:hypothetical protein
VFDQVQGAFATPTSPAAPQLFGTLWPLLSNRIVRVYDVSALLQSGDDNFGCSVANFTIQLQFTDNQGNAIATPLVLASQTWNNAVIGGTGLGIQANGDPLIAFKSNMLFTNQTDGIPAAFRVQTLADVVTDGTTNLSMFLTMVFDDIAAS